MTVVAVIVALALTQFSGGFNSGVQLTVISDRAGLVMNPDAKVKLRDVQVGKVVSIDDRVDGSAVLHLQIDPDSVAVIPANVRVDIASSTVFGAKYVQLVAPADASADSVHPGQVIAGEHVTVEINTVFEQLTDVLSAVQPEQLNQTLTALSSALNGRGAKVAQAISDTDTALQQLEPSLGNLGHDIATANPVLTTLADVAPDLLTTLHNATTIGATIVERKTDLDALLVSVIGLADTGQEVIGSNRSTLTDLLHLLVPVTELTDRYEHALNCALAGAVELAKTPPLRVPGAEVMASLLWGADPYRYPGDLPKVAATGGPQCVGLPRLPFETRPPYVVADVGTNQYKYGNQGIELNTAGLKEWLLGHPVEGPPRNSAQIGMPG